MIPDLIDPVPGDMLISTGMVVSFSRDGTDFTQHSDLSLDVERDGMLIVLDVYKTRGSAELVYDKGPRQDCTIVYIYGLRQDSRKAWYLLRAPWRRRCLIYSRDFKEQKYEEIDFKDGNESRWRKGRS